MTSPTHRTGGRRAVAAATLLAALAAFAARAAGAETAPPAAPPLLAPTSDGAVVELPDVDPAIPSPAVFLGYPLGERFTHHDRILAYLDRLAATGRVRLATYGTTYEGRPLRLVAVSSPGNLERLEEIRTAHLRLADPRGLATAERERLAASLPAVVWLAYGVHGDESSSSEAAMATLYLLAAARGDLAAALDRVVVLVDPLVNPDGRERYVHFYEETRGRVVDPRPSAAEHWQPWPGGRSNHYLVDLNRDWAWATQRETRARLAAYRGWEPQVYVDFHEMGRAESYYFPPAAEPMHPQIPARLRGFFEIFGRANAAAFDRRGWTYFARETFDLYYPAYGDTYPSLRGAVGMTYEVGGGGRGGLAVDLPAGGRLTLADRIARHLTTSLATVRTAAAQSQRLLASFAEGRLDSAGSAPRTYLLAGDAPESAALAELLATHGIEVGVLGEEKTISVVPLGGSGTPAAKSFPAGTLAVSAAQPLGELVRALLDPAAPMSASFLQRQRELLEANVDNEFYDITAWALPIAYNVPAWTAEGAVAERAWRRAAGPHLEGDGELGYLAAPQGLASYRLAARLLGAGFRVHVAQSPLSLGGRAYAPGSLFVPRPAVRGAELDALLADESARSGIALRRVSSSFTEGGIFLGSSSMAAIRVPRIGILAGPGTDTGTTGDLWQLLDDAVEAPVTRVELATLDDNAVQGYDVLVLAGEGDLRSVVAPAVVERLQAWVRDGGVLIAVGDTVRWLAERELVSVKTWRAPADPESGDASPGGGAVADREIPIPGAAVAGEVAAFHPLTLGLPSPPATLVVGAAVYEPTGNPRRDVVVARRDDPVVAGFAWPEAADRIAGSLLVATQPSGRGSYVLFAQDPAFRMFWRATMPLFLNAAIYGPSLLPDAGR